MAELVMLKGLDVEIQLPYSDHSKSPIHLVANLVYHKRTKHIKMIVILVEKS